MNRWLSKLSIRWILPVLIVAPVLTISLILVSLAYRSGKSTADELAGQEIRQIHQRIEAHLDSLMNLPPAIDQLNLARLRGHLLALDDPGRNPQLIVQTLQIFPDVSSIVLGSADGRVMWFIRYPGEASYEYAIKSTPNSPMQEHRVSPDGQIDPHILRTYQYTPVVRPWYHDAVQANAPTWGNVYAWIRGGKVVTLGIPYVQPYRDAQGKLLGVINCELTFADISAFLKRLEIGKTGIAFIMERDGNLIATSTGLSCMNDRLERVSATNAPDPRIATAAKKLFAQPGSLGKIYGVQMDNVRIGSSPSQMVVSSYHNRTNLDWLVVTLVPDADFLTGIQRARRTSMLIGAIAVLVAMALGFRTALWMLTPILAVVSHARRIGAGDVDTHINRHDNREITELSTALNQMSDGLRDRMKLRHALDLAMEVQQTLLPTRTPKVRGLDIAARSKYCDETGGDYYDYLDVEGMGPHSLMIALGDVAGHGIAAAMLMATARGVLRSQVRTQGSLGKLLTHLNEHLVSDTKGVRFMTMLLAVIDVSSMTMRWASAGHDQPLIYDPQKGFSIEIDPECGGMPLGVMESDPYQEHTFSHLRVGQVMLIGTDGLWESKSPADEEFGKKRVGQAIAAVAHLSAGEIEAEVYKQLIAFCQGRPNDDDITYVVIKFTGES